VRIEKLLPGPAERIWEYLTDQARRRLWLAAGIMEPYPGGQVEHLFRHRELSDEATPERYRDFDDSPAMPGEVTQWDPPRTLAYTWPGDNGASEVTFELFPEGRDVLLVLTHRRLGNPETMVSVASGWDAHLGILLDRLNGEPPRGFWSAHARLEAIYRDRLALTTERGTTPEYMVQVEREFDASAAALYAAWTEPTVMNRWFGRVDADVRPGGRFRVESDGDNGEVLAHVGQYLALEPDRLVKQTFAVESDEPNRYVDEFIAISFRDISDGRARLILSDGWDGLTPTDEDIEKTRQGWGLWLDFLERLFNENPALRK
jgi:uncharacterized protein YndB with AHSA1/START domain